MVADRRSFASALTRQSSSVSPLGSIEADAPGWLGVERSPFAAGVPPVWGSPDGRSGRGATEVSGAESAAVSGSTGTGPAGDGVGEIPGSGELEGAGDLVPGTPSGMRTVTLVPGPPLLSSRDPPSCLTMRWIRVRPSPSCPARLRVVKKGSQARAATLGSIPGPSSRTVRDA